MVPVESDGSGSAEELWPVGDAEDGLEPHPESADFGGSALARHVREHETGDACFINWFAVVGAVEEPLCQADQDALARSGLAQGVGPVLDEFVQLPMGIAAVCGVVFLVGVLRNVVRLRAIGVKGLLGLGCDETPEGAIWPRPCCLAAAGGQLQ